MYAFTGNKKFLILSLALPYLFDGFYYFLVWPNPMIIIGILAIVSFYLHSELKKKQKLITTAIIIIAKAIAAVQRPPFFSKKGPNFDPNL